MEVFIFLNVEALNYPYFLLFYDATAIFFKKTYPSNCIFYNYYVSLI